MPEYRVAVPIRTRTPEGIKHEATSFYTITTKTPSQARIEAEKQALEALRQQQANNSIVGWYIHTDQIEAYDPKKKVNKHAPN